MLLFFYQIAIDIENESKQQNKYLDGMVSQHSLNLHTCRLWYYCTCSLDGFTLKIMLI